MIEMPPGNDFDAVECLEVYIQAISERVANDRRIRQEELDSFWMPVIVGLRACKAVTAAIIKTKSCGEGGKDEL